MSQSTVAKYFSLTWEMTKINILSAMEYRFSFWMLVFGMVVNDIGLLFIWVIFFQRFPEINGWQFQDTVLLFSLSTMAFSLVMIFGGGAFEISRKIRQGELDYYLSFPKNILWHCSISKTDISAIGDFLFSIIIFFFSGDINLSKVGLFLLMVLPSAAILFSFIVITQSLAFWIGDFEDGAYNLFHALLGFSLYPQSVFHGLLKLLMFTLLPAFFIVTLPVELVKNFSLLNFAFLVTVAIGITILAVKIFFAGLKKYESGNLINVKS